MMAKSMWLLTVLVILTAVFDNSAASSTMDVQSFNVKSDILFRFATTKMSSTIRNLDNKTQKLSFPVMMPKRAYVLGYSVIIGKKRYRGKIVKRSQESGEKGPRDTNIFKVSMKVPAASTATFTLFYQQMLQRRHGFYEYEIFINPGQVVADFLIDVGIQENRPLTFVLAQALRTDGLLMSCLDKYGRMEMNELPIVNRTGRNTASVQYRPSASEQGEGGKGVSGRFVVQYSVTSPNELTASAIPTTAYPCSTTMIDVSESESSDSSNGYTAPGNPTSAGTTVLDVSESVSPDSSNGYTAPGNPTTVLDVSESASPDSSNGYTAPGNPTSAGTTVLDVSEPVSPDSSNGYTAPGNPTSADTTVLDVSESRATSNRKGYSQIFFSSRRSGKINVHILSFKLLWASISRK
ncbi:inter-alpha-trypsin inhibitor heavy chain h3 [Plakobranchus ocellatus]|uniref:Inter-alpha-trypsin inhibitor heavy chain h3 n=1 Tax=Plakobranchus ocellatus TaxID=259542 RepID=A0AAV3Y075_9GAST|nr:inter-alpha-trypsin inhibitor heavy chain h3 [Plakobranchus ocellatus]